MRGDEAGAPGLVLADRQGLGPTTLGTVFVNNQDN
jgi:hypothetical protein